MSTCASDRCPLPLMATPPRRPRHRIPAPSRRSNHRRPRHRSRPGQNRWLARPPSTPLQPPPRPPRTPPRTKALDGSPRHDFKGTPFPTPAAFDVASLNVQYRAASRLRSAARIADKEALSALVSASESAAGVTLAIASMSTPRAAGPNATATAEPTLLVDDCKPRRLMVRLRGAECVTPHPVHGTPSKGSSTLEPVYAEARRRRSRRRR